MPDATAPAIDPQEHDRLKALVGELSTQLQEAVNARTNMGVTLRLLEGRLQAAQKRIAEIEAKPPPKKRK